LLEGLFSLAQIAGYVALVTYVAAYAIRDDNKLKIAFSASNVLWVVHYYLIGAQTAAVTTAIIILRNLFSLNSPDFSFKKKCLLLLIFSVLLIAAGIFTWAGWISVIPVFCCIAITYGVFFLSGLQLRTVFLVCDMAWLAHGIVVVSYGGIVYALGAVIVNAFTMRSMQKTRLSAGL